LGAVGCWGYILTSVDIIIILVFAKCPNLALGKRLFKKTLKFLFAKGPAEALGIILFFFFLPPNLLCYPPTIP
jgi:hypothetical protein